MKEESAMAEPMRRMLDAAIEDGAVAAVLIYETADGRVGTWSSPNLLCVRTGLVRLAVVPGTESGE